MTTSDPSPRVPAWKRIGLKLKYANETADALPEQAQPTTQRGPQPAVHQEEKPQRKRLIKDSALETPAKRSRPDDAHISTRTGPQKTTTNHPFHDPERSKFPAPTGVFKAPNQTPKRIVFGDDESSTPLQTQTVQPASLRKSVSFTPDTKREDGDSVSTSLKPLKSGDNQLEIGPSEEAIQSPSVATDDSAKKQKKPREQKKPKKPKNSKTVDTDSIQKSIVADVESHSKEAPIYLEYLTQYYADRANWKFNKNKQNDLFRNLFNIYRIPPKHNPSIVEYIRGLKGQARQRVAQDAEDVLKAIWISENPGEDPMSLEDAAARRLAYYQALQRSRQRYEESGAGRTEHADETLKQVMEEYERGKRAEMLFEELFNPDPQPQPQPSPSSIAPIKPSAATSIMSIPRATRIIETTRTAPNASSEVHSTTNTKTKRKRKARTDVPSSSSSSSSSSAEDSSSDSEESKSTDQSHHLSSRSSSKPKPPTFSAQQPQHPSRKAKNDIEDDDDFFNTALLDAKFGKTQT